MRQFLTSSPLSFEKNWSLRQGLVRSLPEGWEKKYPNLGFAMHMTGIYDLLKAENNGDLSVLIRPMDHYRDYIDDFRKAYGDGKNLRAMMSEGQYKYIDTYGFDYRNTIFDFIKRFTC